MKNTFGDPDMVKLGDEAKKTLSLIHRRESKCNFFNPRPHILKS